MTPKPSRLSAMHNIAEVADKLRVSDKTIRRLITAGKLACHRIGSQIRVSEDQINAYLTVHGTRHDKWP